MSDWIDDVCSSALCAPRSVANLGEDKNRARVRLSALAALVARFYGPRPDALRPPDLRYASEMIGLIRRAMSSWLVLGLLGLVLIAFIVTGVGDPFGSMGGGGRRLAQAGGAAIPAAQVRQQPHRPVRAARPQAPQTAT